MINIFTLLPLLFFIVSSYYFNHKKLGTLKSEIFKISLLEAILSYTIAYLLFLEGFITMFFWLFLIFVIALIIGFFIFFKEKDYNKNFWILSETIKNNLVLFCLTILPIYVFFTIFRFQKIYLQLILSILITAVILCLSVLTKKFFTPIFEKIATYITESAGFSNFAYVCLSIFLIWAVCLSFDLPVNKVKEYFNLSNNVRYLSFDGYPTNINNNFDAKEIIQIDSKYSIDSEITDYYYNQTHLYLYTNNGDLIVYDISKKEVVYDVNLGNPGNFGLYSTERKSKFTFYDDHLILLGKNGTYLVTPDNTTNISSINSYGTAKFYQNNELYYLYKQGFKKYKIYKFNDGNLTLTEKINLTTTTYDNLLIISQNCFHEENNQYVLHDDPSISFKKELGFPTYDEYRQIMYYVQTMDHTGLHRTTYLKIDANGETSEITLAKIHNSKAVIIDDYIYFTKDDLEEDEDIGRIEIMKSNYEFDAIYNHLELQPFWFMNKFDKSYIANYQEKDNILEFLQVDQSNKRIVFTLQQLQEREIGLNSPFYTHYGIGIFIPIIFAFFIPFTNYREKNTFMGFEKITNQ